MAEKKKVGLVDRLLLGKEKSEDYARGTLPSNRWELFWDIFKGRFGKLVIVNLLTLLFCIPFALLIFFRYIALLNYGALYPFSQGLGLGYMAPPSVVGYAENIVFQVNLIVFLFLPIAVTIMALGISGGAYVIRNMIWTEGIFVANDFWKGIKQNAKQMIVIGVVYSLLFYISILSISIAERNIAMENGAKWLWIISEIFSYGVLVVFSIMTMHMITMSVTYKLKYRHLVKNSFLFTIALAPQNIFFLLLCAIPFLFLTLGGFLLVAGLIILLLMGLSLALLIWTDYSHWAYDRFINDKVEGAQKNRGIYEKVQKSDSGALKQYREQLALAKRNSLNNRPIKPITDDELKIAELPTSFNRADLEKLRESKQAIYDDHARYVDEHKDDEEFKLTPEEQAFVDKDTSDKAKRIEKAKKELAKRNKQ